MKTFAITYDYKYTLLFGNRVLIKKNNHKTLEAETFSDARKAIKKEFPTAFNLKVKEVSPSEQKEEKLANPSIGEDTKEN